jgi:two-component system response regulator MprA
VLVLDDDRSVAEVAAAMLVDGYEVLAASEVAEGLRMLDSERPDVVVLNLDLPGVDVVELLATLRSGTAGEPAVLVAADPEDRHARDRALAAGAAGFVAKPLVEAELRAEVAAALERRPALTTARPRRLGGYAPSWGRWERWTRRSRSARCSCSRPTACSGSGAGRSGPSTGW